MELIIWDHCAGEVKIIDAFSDESRMFFKALGDGGSSEDVAESSNESDDAIEPKSAVLYKVSADADGKVEIAVVGEKPLEKDMLNQDVSTFLKSQAFFKPFMYSLYFFMIILVVFKHHIWPWANIFDTDIFSCRNTYKDIGSRASMVLQNYQNFIELTSNIIYIVAFGGGLKCSHKIHLITQCSGPARDNNPGKGPFLY